MPRPITAHWQARAVALRTLIDYEKRDAYLGPLLSATLARSDLDRRDRALVTELTLGTVRMKLTLDHALAGFSNTPLADLEAGLVWSLRLGAYQVLFTDVPDYAAVDAGATATAEAVGRRAVGYFNAVMRAFVAGRESVAFPDPTKEPASYLESRYSHPRWVVEMWVEQLGFEKAKAICAADNDNPSLSVRTNLLRSGRQELASSLQARGLEVTEGRLAPECLRVRGSGYVGDLPEFASGLFAVQDEGAMVVSRQLDPRRGMRVLDMCAAPGGKANHLAELIANDGTVLAVDMNAARLNMAGETAHRLGNSSLELLEADATSLSGRLAGEFDRVLVDAPCTGLGTLGRRPDARWRKRAADIGPLAELQARLLEEGASMVASGGTLAYSTCTISRTENQDVVEGFLAANRGRYEPVEVSIAGSEGSPYLQLYPDTHGCDGMFVAVMRRAS